MRRFRLALRVPLRWLLLATALTACASTKDEGDAPPDDASSGIPDASSEMDGGSDGSSSEVDRAPCSDCEYFPDVCSNDTLCANGPFDPSTQSGALDPRMTINVIRGRSADDVWAAGTLGALAHFDGTSWARSDLGAGESLRALWLNNPGEVAIANFARVYTRDLDVPDGGKGPSAGGWTFGVPTAPADLPWPSNIRLGSAWAAPGSKWLWTASAVWSNLSTGLWRMRLSPSNGVEVQAGVATAVCTLSSCTLLKGIHGASADALWAVGESGSAVLITGAEGDTPSVKAFNTRTFSALNAVWVASPADAWAVGTAGTIRHYRGDAMLWEVVTDVPTDEDLRAVWGSSSSDVWAVGDAGVVLHYDGTRWSRVKIAGLGARRPELASVWVSAPGHVWIGGQGVVLSLGGKP